MANKNESPSPNTYRYTMNMIYTLDGEVYNIENYCIKSLVIDSNYKDLNMPMMFIRAAINKKLLDLMIQNQEKSTVIFNVQRCIKNSDVPNLFTDYINEECIYFIADDINKLTEYDYNNKENKDRQDLFKLVTIGLLVLSHVNNNKKPMNGVFEGRLSSIMYHMVSNLPVLLEPPKDNPILEVYIPPTNSIKQSLDYLNNLHVMYNKGYLFFIDFGCTYLMSTSGKGVPRKGYKINNVQITLKNTIDESSKVQGMIIDEQKSVYYMEVDAIDCELSDNHLPDKIFNKIKATSSSGILNEMELESKTEYIKKKTKSIRVPNDNIEIVENMKSEIENKSVQLLVQKTNIDAEVFTPNKVYNVNASDVYKSTDYDGQYLLNRKRELYIRENEEFIMDVMLLFGKLL